MWRNDNINDRSLKKEESTYCVGNLREDVQGEAVEDRDRVADGTNGPYTMVV